MNQLVKVDHDAVRRREHAENIRQLLIDWTKHSLELGKELSQARETFPPQQVLIKGKRRRVRVGWKQWLQEEFMITERWARLLIQVHVKLGTRVSGITTSYRVLRLLSQSNTPESARQEIIGRTRKGERITSDEAKKIIIKHHPKPAEANKRARETGKPVLASDGYIYFGATKDEAMSIEKRRSVVYGMRRAIQAISDMEISPVQFLAYALPHQLHEFNLNGEVGRAAKWLAGLNDAWKK